MQMKMVIYRMLSDFMTARTRFLMVLGVFWVSTLILSVAVNAQTLDDVRSVSEQGVREGVASQGRVNNLSEEIDQAIREYKAALAQLASLREYNDQLDKLIKAQAAEQVLLRQQIEDVTNVDRTIVPLMFRMIESLEAFIVLDVPFLLSERKERAANLRALMDRSDISPAEKYRRILEAFEIENEYGRTIESYDAPLSVEGSEREAVFLRIGRIALIFQTPDGDHSGVWSQKQREFIDLEGDFDSEIRAALRVAKQQAAPNLLILPLTVDQ